MMHEQRQYQQQYQPQHHGSQQCQYPAASQQQQPQLYNQDSYLSINESYPGLQKIYDDPPFYLIEEFLSAEECEFLISLSHGHLSTSPVVGAGNGEVSPSRTSSSCYLAREDLPFVVQKVCALTGKPAMHLELPQVSCFSSSSLRGSRAIFQLWPRLSSTQNGCHSVFAYSSPLLIILWRW
jgi:hypothetical protein